MTPRDPRCDDDRCEPDENGNWEHAEECGAESRPMPVVNPDEYRAGSFLHYLLGRSS